MKESTRQEREFTPAKLAAAVSCIRNVLAGICILVASIILFFWATSYTYNFEVFNNDRVPQFELYCLESWNGKLRISHSNNMGKPSKLNHWKVYSILSTEMEKDYPQHATDWTASTFGMIWTTEEKGLALPHWLWAAVFGMISFGLKTKPKTQFTFLELFLLFGAMAFLSYGLTIATYDLAL